MPPSWKNVKSVGDWELKGILGQGGFGEVHHWINRTTNQEIATKRIKNAGDMSLDQQRKLEERWKEEYFWTQKLQEHTAGTTACIVAGVKLSDNADEFMKHLHIDHFRQLPIIILEYCNGGDVRKLLQQPQNANGLREFEVRQILGCLRQAVDFLHTRCQLCHRDLKPDNIIMHRLSDGRRLYKLTDFGLSRKSPDKTIMQSMVGTRHYYAPEVVETSKYNNKVDYWSMGIIAYELVTAVLPFIPHQTVIDIHMNLKKKPANCIAITEDHVNAMQFHFHSDIPIGHHLSEPWSKAFTKWLPLALNTDYSQRGAAVATDEVQAASAAPTIFTEIDRLLSIKVLTIFAASIYKRIDLEVTPSTTMEQLNMFISTSTGLPSTSIYLVLPLGHPVKSLTKATRPIDLYVEKWSDNSEESLNPPVMIYAFNVIEKCPYVKTDPFMPAVLQHYMNTKFTKLDNWLVERLVLDMHHVLNTEQAKMKMLVLGFENYALSLEHEVLQYQRAIKDLDVAKDMCCGAMEQFQAFIKAAEEQQKINLSFDEEWRSNWKSLKIKHKEIVTSIAKIIHHFESILSNVRTESIKRSKEIKNNMTKNDIYKIKDFRKKYLRRVITYSELMDISIQFAKARFGFLESSEMKALRESTNHTHLRFCKIPSAVHNGHHHLRAVQDQLLQLQLQMPSLTKPKQETRMFDLTNGMSQLSFNATNVEMASSLDAFDSLSTGNVISEAMRTRQILEDAMEIDRTDHN